jgi:hypothetical protein
MDWLGRRLALSVGVLVAIAGSRFKPVDGRDKNVTATEMQRPPGQIDAHYRRSKNLRAVQLLLGHRKLESTVRYLGVEVEDALEISEQTEV